MVDRVKHLRRFVVMGALGALWLDARLAVSAPTEARTQKIATVLDARKLCLGLRSEGEVTFRGDEVVRGKARSEYQNQRRELLAQNYTVDLPAAAFQFREYEYDAQRLSLDLSRSMRLGESVDLSLARADEDDLAFAVIPRKAEVLVSDRSAGKLSLRLLFRLSQTDLSADPCVRVSGGRILRIRVDPLSASLVGHDGRVLYVADRRGAQVAATQTPEIGKGEPGGPRVALGRPAIKGNRDPEPFVVAAAALAPILKTCYEAGLANNQELRGSLVLGLSVNGEGRVDKVRTEIDALGDERVSACTMARLRGVSGFPRKPASFSLPVFFARE